MYLFSGMTRTQTHSSDLIPAREAAVRFSLSRDYVTRLAREGRIEGRRIGNAWHVSVQSLEAFCSQQGAAKVHRHKKLADTRRKEYRGGHVVVAEQETSPEPVIEEPMEAEPEREVEPSAAVAAMHAAVGQIAAKKHIRHMQTAPLYAIHPMLDLAHRATALVGAIALVVGAYMFISPQDVKVAGGIARDVLVGAAAAVMSAHAD